jgi:hypothetical protein
MTYFRWEIVGSKATCVEHPAVGFRAGNVAALDEQIQAYEEPFVLAAEAERIAERNRQLEAGVEKKWYGRIPIRKRSNA